MILGKLAVLDFFLSGFKPAIIVDIDDDFPELELFPSMEEGRDILYFQNKKMKDKYIEKAKSGVNLVQLTGETLGYPPRAVYQFAYDIGGMIKEEQKFMVNYYGMDFVSYEHTLEEDINWLKETYPIPNEYPGFIYIRSFNINIDNHIHFKYQNDIPFERIKEKLKIL